MCVCVISFLVLINYFQSRAVVMMNLMPRTFVFLLRHFFFRLSFSLIMTLFRSPVTHGSFNEFAAVDTAAAAGAG